jgi:hypothetical protein
MRTKCNFFKRHDGGNYCEHVASDNGYCEETIGSNGDIMIECEHAHTLCDCGDLLSHKDADSCLACAIDSAELKHGDR